MVYYCMKCMMTPIADQNSKIFETAYYHLNLTKLHVGYCNIDNRAFQLISDEKKWEPFDVAPRRNQWNMVRRMVMMAEMQMAGQR